MAERTFATKADYTLFFIGVGSQLKEIWAAQSPLPIFVTLSGANGVGKSTAVEAIVEGLMGPSSYKIEDRHFYKIFSGEIRAISIDREDQRCMEEATSRPQLDPSLDTYPVIFIEHPYNSYDYRGYDIALGLDGDRRRAVFEWTAPCLPLSI